MTTTNFFTVLNQHQQAMQKATLAQKALDIGNKENARLLFMEAGKLEKETAEYFELVPENEPTRSIFYLSAATLFWWGGDAEECRQALRQALQGWPSASTKKDIFELLGKTVSQGKEAEGE